MKVGSGIAAEKAKNALAVESQGLRCVKFQKFFLIDKEAQKGFSSEYISYVKKKMSPKVWA